MKWVIDEQSCRSYSATVRYRRLLIESLLVSLFWAGIWSREIVHHGSVPDYVSAAAIFLLPVLAVRVIVRVGAQLMDDDSARNRKTGADGRRL
jgi:hypothetical protein